MGKIIKPFGFRETSVVKMEEGVSPVCIFCYKIVDEDMNDPINTNVEKVNKFYKFCLRLSPDRLETANSHIPTAVACKACVVIVDSFNEFYHQIQCIQLQLDWQLDKMERVMKCADKIPSRVKTFRKRYQISAAAEPVQSGQNNWNILKEIRKQIKSQVSKHLSKVFPRVGLKNIGPVDNISLSPPLNPSTSENARLSTKSNGNFLLGWISTFIAVTWCYFPNASNQNGCNDVLSTISPVSIIPDINQEHEPVSGSDQTSNLITDTDCDNLRDNELNLHLEEILLSPLPISSPTECFIDAVLDSHDSPHQPNCISNDNDVSDQKHEDNLSSILESLQPPFIARIAELMPEIHQHNASSSSNPTSPNHNVNVSSQSANFNGTTINSPIILTHSEFPVQINQDVNDMMKSKIPIDQCPKSNSFENNLSNQSITVDPDPETSQTIVVSSPSRQLRTIFKCSSCNQTFSSLARLDEHKKTCVVEEDSTNFVPVSYIPGINQEPCLIPVSESEPIPILITDCNDLQKTEPSLHVEEILSSPSSIPSPNEYFMDATPDSHDYQLQPDISGINEATEQKVEENLPITLASIELPFVHSDPIYENKSEPQNIGSFTSPVDNVNASSSSDNFTDTTANPCVIPTEADLHVKIKQDSITTTLNAHPCEKYSDTHNHEKNELTQTTPKAFETAQIIANEVPSTSRQLRAKFRCISCNLTFSSLARLDAHKKTCDLQDFNETDEENATPAMSNVMNDGDDDISSDEEMGENLNENLVLNESSMEEETNSDLDPGSSEEETQVDTRKRKKTSTQKRPPKRIAKNRLKRNVIKYQTNKTFKSQRQKLSKANVQYRNQESVSETSSIEEEVSSDEDISQHESQFENRESFELELTKKYRLSNGKVELSQASVTALKLTGVDIRLKDSEIPLQVCNIGGCEPSLFSNDDLQYHQRLHGHFQCSFCEFNSNFAPNLITHELEHQSDDQDISCPKCVNFKIDRLEYKTHFLEHHLETSVSLQPAKCPVCFMYFPGENYVPLVHFVNQHDLGRLDDPTKTFNCDEENCLAYFLTVPQAVDHAQMVHNKARKAASGMLSYSNKFSCDLCSLKFANRTLLLYHYRVIHPITVKTPKNLKITMKVNDMSS